MSFLNLLCDPIDKSDSQLDRDSLFSPHFSFLFFFTWGGGGGGGMGKFGKGPLVSMRSC